MEKQNNLKCALLSSIVNLNDVIHQEIKDQVTLKSKIIYLVGKKASTDIYYKEACTFYNHMGASSVEYFNLEEKENDQLIDAIKSCDILHLGGGNTFEFSRLMIEGNYFDIFKEILPKVKLIVGVSAGAIIQTNDLQIASFLDEDNTNIETVGLGIYELSCLPHFNTIDQQTLIEVKTYTKHIDNKIFGINDGGGILIYSDNHLEVFDTVII
ncbi:Type 1 glutamine amidotransferase-like domain-containing protein [Mollicutes bacterium LVI A0039]|nr:Type 1 glutamine amidotransferase-like domain-containing protein [Mollicutes bacterium LVI A0039]